MTNEELHRIADDLIFEYLKSLTSGKPSLEKKTDVPTNHKCTRCNKCTKTNNTNLTHKEHVDTRIKKYPIKDVKYFDKTTVVFWKDGTKTISICRDEDEFNPWAGLAIAICKKLIGKTAFHDIFETYIPDKYRPEKNRPKHKKGKKQSAD